MKTFAGIVAAAWAVMAGPAFAGQVAIPSPAGQAEIRIEDDASRFSVRARGETVIAASPLGLELDGAPAFGALTLEHREDVEVDRNIPLVATKASVARDHYRGATLTFRETRANARRLIIDVRAYDDGVAFRYRIDDAGTGAPGGERTAFVLPGDPECLATKLEAAHEMPFERLKVSQLSRRRSYDVPLVCTSRSGRASLAIAQAHLEGYAGASLRREGEALRVQLSPRARQGGAGLCVQERPAHRVARRHAGRPSRRHDRLAADRQPQSAAGRRFQLGQAGQGGLGLVVRPAGGREAGHGHLPAASSTSLPSRVFPIT